VKYKYLKYCHKGCELYINYIFIYIYIYITVTWIVKYKWDDNIFLNLHYKNQYFLFKRITHIRMFKYFNVLHIMFWGIAMTYTAFSNIAMSYTEFSSIAMSYTEFSSIAKSEKITDETLHLRIVYHRSTICFLTCSILVCKNMYQPKITCSWKWKSYCKFQF
jgi:hypothetical protein